MADWVKNKYDKNIRIMDSGRGWLVDDTNDATITVNPIYVGTVTNGGGYPATRPNGDALSDGDYVKVDPSSTLPFTIGGVTFNTVNDQAVWDELAGEWKYDPSSSKETAGITVSDPSGEDYPSPGAATAYVQQDINMHVKYWLDWLVENIKKAGYSFTLEATDVDSNRTLTYTLYDKTGTIISSKTWDNFLLNSRKVAGINLVDDITATELETALKDVTIVYTNKTINADNNTILNLEVDNFNADSITDSTEIALSTNWTDTQVPTTKAIANWVASDIDMTYSDGKSGNPPTLTVKILNAKGETVDSVTVNICNNLDTAVFKDDDINTDVYLKLTRENGNTENVIFTDVVVTDHVQTLTNKTIDADNNTISNLEVDNFKVNTAGSATDGVIVTEINDAETDEMLPTAKAVYDYSTYGVDSHVDVANNKVTIDLEDKDGVDRDTTTFDLQKLDSSYNETTRVFKIDLTDGTNVFTTTNKTIPSDIRIVASLPATGAVDTSCLYSATSETPQSIYWCDGTNWYNLSDTNGIITVGTLPAIADAKSDCFYYIAATKKLWWSNGTKFVDLSSLVRSMTATFDSTTNVITTTLNDDNDDPICNATVDISDVLKADRGLDVVSNKIGHTNTLTADTTNTANPVALQYDEYGHVTGVTKLWAVTNAFTPVGSTDTFQMNLTAYESGATAYYTKNLIFTDGLKLARTDDGGSGTEADPYIQKTTVGHSNSVTPITTSGVYKIAVDAYGHITGYTALTAETWTFTLTSGSTVTKTVYVG